MFILNEKVSPLQLMLKGVPMDYMVAPTLWCGGLSLLLCVGYGGGRGW